MTLCRCRGIYMLRRLINARGVCMGVCLHAHLFMGRARRKNGKE
nr:MAG TPA: hypothetical protein [Caudoviricetes sp.]